MLQKNIIKSNDLRRQSHVHGLPKNSKIRMESELNQLFSIAFAVTNENVSFLIMISSGFLSTWF